MVSELTTDRDRYRQKQPKSSKRTKSDVNSKKPVKTRKKS